MEVITIEKAAYKNRISEIKEMKGMLSMLMNDRKKTIEIINPDTAFIRVRDAVKKYGCTTRTLKNYCKEHNIQRLRVGRENLIHEIDLAKAFKKGRLSRLDWQVINRGMAPNKGPQVSPQAKKQIP